MSAPRKHRPTTGHDRRCSPAVGLSVAAALGAVVLPIAAAPAAEAASYTVRPGDTLSALAARSGSSVAALAAVNGLTDPGRLRVGQLLQVPAPPTVGDATGGAVIPGTPAAAPAQAGTASWTVTAGDTVSAIAARTGTTVAALAAANGLRDPGRIVVGQRLVVPARGVRPAAPTPATPATPVATAPAPSTPDGSTSGAAPRSVVVRAGDTVSAIAARAGLGAAAVLRANGLRATSIIHPGLVLTLPGATTPSATPGNTAAAPTAPSTKTPTTSPPTVIPVSNSFAGRTYASGVTNAATLNRETLAARSVPTTSQMQQIVRNTATAMGLDPALAMAVAFQESGFNMRAVSPANAVGVMQVIPSSGRWASDLVGRPLDLLDPQDNATAGVAILASLVKSAPDRPTAIAGYYQGLAGVMRNGMYADTVRYVANVQALSARFA